MYLINYLKLVLVKKYKILYITGGWNLIMKSMESLMNERENGEDGCCLEGCH